MRKFDKIIIGAGLYGCYAANLCGKRNETVLVLEYDEAPFQRATYINQARVHMGYHYPRSLSTAMKSSGRIIRNSWKNKKISKFSTVPELTGSQRQKNHL